MKRLSVLFIVAAGMLVPDIALAQGGPDGWYGPHMLWWSGYGMIFGPVFMIVVLALIVGAVVLMARWLGVAAPAAGHAVAGPTPHDILKERFARGEIDQNEYDERRRILGE
jgi:putative membrane protein